MNFRRVVVTGLGALTPIGNTVQDYWKGLSAGVSGAGPITKFDAEKFKLAVTKGQDPDGSQLKPDMPRWNLNDDDLTDLIAFLKTLP